MIKVVCKVLYSPLYYIKKSIAYNKQIEKDYNDLKEAIDNFNKTRM